MSQTGMDKPYLAEDRARETICFVKSVMTITLCKYTPEEKIHIILEGFWREVTANQLRRRRGIKPDSH